MKVVATMLQSPPDSMTLRGPWQKIIIMPPPNVAWHTVFVLFVRASVSCVRPENVVNKISCTVFDTFHQTYINDVMGIEMNALNFGVKRSKFKVTVE